MIYHIILTVTNLSKKHFLIIRIILTDKDVFYFICLILFFLNK